MHKAEVRLDVTAALEGNGPLSTAATVYWRDQPEPAEVVAFAFPGGGYNRAYYDLRGDSLNGYSQAEHHVARGWVFVACDHLGVGDSSLPSPELLNIEVLASANCLAVESVLDGLTKGTLVDGLEPLVDVLRVGMGQSMGGCLLIAQQARHRSFDAVAVLGYSAIHTVIPVPPGATEVPIGRVPRGETGLSVEEQAGLATDEQFRYAFHWDDVADEIVAADIAGFPLRRVLPSWGSATFPGAAASMLSPGCIAAEAAEIDVPVFIGVGERDVVPDPSAEPSAYRRTLDVTLFVMPRSAHMHNFAGTRAQLWRRLHAWVEGARALRT